MGQMDGLNGMMDGSDGGIKWVVEMVGLNERLR